MTGIYAILAVTGAPGAMPGVSQASQEAAELLLDGARYGDLEDVSQALAGGASVDCRDEQGRTGGRAAACRGLATRSAQL